jgi:outer membrane protein assembly factor BamE (lipoprotein component of BamABCDE complex)
MKNTKVLLALVAIVLLSGCAGTNFKRPDAEALAVGKSTSADIARVMGVPPFQQGELLKNNEKIKTTRYAYAEGAGTGRYPGVVPARAMVFSTFNDLLVGQEFVSSFPEDATEFDESKISTITKGRSTRTEVLSLLGKPNGEAAYPLIKNKAERGVIYSYSHAKGTVFNMKFYSKALIVSFDTNNVVTDVDYTSAGEK